jgi:outer membrane biosynthesis protein TonB
LPWTLSAEEERRFRRIFLYSAITGLVLSLAIPVLPLPQKPQEVVVEIPPRLAKLILEKKEPPPPPPVPKVEAPKPRPQPKKVEKPKVRPRPKPEPVAKKPSVKPEPEPRVDVAQARRKAARSGVLAFQDTLADLRDMSVVKKVSNQTRLSQGGKQARRTER